ncbi:AH receptor-interacting protein [Lingula anatina]|uniref:AH receptor-interacting protein n=1 Tax=Lingula anatina TaxID=7574 RepID=A0A1S3HSU8_LINAN|nr:AH receptor-interacting protein [Lingula anatina]|eukprot:XP_013389110.1 AH receptor-interacting protein [Lingula anatina]
MDDSSAGIEKKILASGKGSLPAFSNGAKTQFHYKTCKLDDDKTVIDDSRKLMKKPMELIIGKKFKLEVLEACVKTMCVGEVAQFTVAKPLLTQYPLVSKQLREIFGEKKKGADHSHHCCGMMQLQQDQGLGYADLDQLMKEPQSLQFTIELLKVEEPGEYKKETWVMDEPEQIAAVPQLKDEGNALYKEKKYSEASAKYGQAIGILEQLSMKEKPHSEEWSELQDRKIPFLLNYSQCLLLLEDYYPVIEHTTTVLERDPGNVKALFRRAKAHVSVWNFDEARADFHKVSELDSTLNSAVKKELKYLDDLQRKKDEEDKAKLQGKMFS